MPQFDFVADPRRVRWWFAGGWTARNWLAFWLAVAILGGVGCRSEKPGAGGDGVDRGEVNSDSQGGTGRSGLSQSGPNATEILAAVRSAYRDATSYRDEGVLDLSYRLHGRRMSEPKRFSTTYVADGKIIVKCFNSQLLGDGDLLECRVFDIETANLDGQRLYLTYADQPPLRKLLDDPIARHFVAGFADLPLGDLAGQPGTWMIPAPASLLTGASLNGWLESPEQLERLPNQTLADANCYVLRSLYRDMTSDVWIDQQTFQIRQMSLPLKLLAGEVITSDEVTDLVLLARFDRAQFGIDLKGTQWQPELDPAAVAVRRFVTLPVDMPSEWIGRKIPALELETPAGQQVTNIDFQQQTTTLIWLTGAEPLDAISDHLATLTSLAGPGRRFGLVFSEAEGSEPGNGTPPPPEKLRKLADRLKWPLFYDRQWQASAELKLAAVPAVVVLDGDIVLQYVGNLSGDDWADRLAAAVRRVEHGDEVAVEMKADYAQYLETYQQQLQAVSAQHLLGGDHVDQSAAPVNAPPHDAAAWSIQPRLAWRCEDLQQAGNLERLDGAPGEARYAVFDGWQTLGLMDQAGELLRKQPLGLDASEAVTRIRRSDDASGRLAAWSPMGRNVRIFDGSLQSVGTIELPHPDDRVLEVVWGGAGRTSELVVLTGPAEAGEETGQLLLADPATGKTRPITDSGGQAAAMLDGELVILRDRQLHPVSMNDGRPTGEPVDAGVNNTRLASEGGKQLVTTGQLDSGDWVAQGWGPGLVREWSIGIGPQWFENAIAPVAGLVLSPAGERSSRLWAIADSANRVQLVTGSGVWLGELESASPLHGLLLDDVQGQVRLLIANARGVECWELGLSRPSPGPR